MFGVPCGCQTTLSPTNLIICSCPSWTRASPKESAIEVWHPQLIHKNDDQNPITSKKIHREWDFLVRNLASDEAIALVWVKGLDFTSVRVAERNIPLRPKAFVYVGFKENSTPSHLSWILNLTELCFQSGVFQAKNGKRQISLDTNRHRHSKPKGNRWILSRISLALIVKWSIPWHENFRPFYSIFTDICP